MKYGCIEYLSEVEPIPLGLPEPCVCRAIKWATAKAANKNGNK